MAYSERVMGQISQIQETLANWQMQTALVKLVTLNAATL